MIAPRKPLSIFVFLGMTAAMHPVAQGQSVTVTSESNRDLHDLIHISTDPITIEVPVRAAITGVDVGFTIRHQWPADLVIFLGSENNNQGVRLDTIVNPPPGPGVGQSPRPFLLYRREVVGLTQFNGEPASQTFTLSISDPVPIDAGFWSSWTITVYFEDLGPVRPTPAIADFRSADATSPPVRGGAAPGLSSGMRFGSVHRAYLNDAGHVQVLASIGEGSTAGESAFGIWSNGGTGVMDLVAFEGQLPPGNGFSGTVFEVFRDLSMNGAGVVSFAAGVKAPGEDDANYALFSELETGASHMEAGVGMPAPGRDGGRFHVLGRPSLTENLAVFPGLLQHSEDDNISGDNDAGIWASDGNTTRVLALEGEPVVARGINAGALFGQPNFWLAAAQSEMVVFSTFVRDNPFEPDHVLLAGSPKVLIRIAGSGDAIDGVTVSRFLSESVDDSGLMAFRATLLNAPAESNVGIFGAALRVGPFLVAVEGGQAPGLPAGVRFERFTAIHPISFGIVFFAYLKGEGVDSANDGCLFRYSFADDALTPIVREGDRARNTTGAVIQTIHAFDANRVSGVTFLATLRPDVGDATESNSHGLWLSDTGESDPALVVRKGDAFEFAPGDMRTITSIAIDEVANALGGVGGAPKVLSETGTVVVRVASTLGHGAYLLDANAVAASPPPTTMSGDIERTRRGMLRAARPGTRVTADGGGRLSSEETRGESRLPASGHRRKAKSETSATALRR